MASNSAQERGLTSKELLELKECKLDPIAFANFCMVIHPIKGKIQFKLYPYQKAVLLAFLNNRFNIVKKFRQGGLTELICLYCLWLSQYHINKNILILSIKDRVAKKVLRRIKYMYKNLPDHLKTPVVNGRGEDVGTASELEFVNGSIITSIPTTEDAGRSEPASLVIIDEAAIIRMAGKIWAALFPTLSTGGSGILNSCITGDTKIVGKHGNFRVDMIAPKSKGRHNVEALGLEVLTHNGRLKRVLAALNKGELKTWEVENSRGKILKATPAHKLLTPQGWKPIKEIIDEGLNAIFYDLEATTKVEETPITVCPEIEEFKPIKGYPKYIISTWGKVYYYKGGNLIHKKPISNSGGYHRVSLHRDNTSRKFQVSRLMATHFIGEIPEGDIVDHINNNSTDNYLTNLQIITRKENAARANKYSHSLSVGTRAKGAGVNYQMVGYILEQGKLGTRGIDIIHKCKELFGKTVNASYITRTIKGTRMKGLYLSKLTKNRKFKETIYDICVEDDESYLTDTQYINHNTPYGVGNFYHETWVEAMSGSNGFNPINLKHWMHPDYDDKWYAQMKAILGPRRTSQEVDGDFLSSGNTVFDLLDIREIEEDLDLYPPIDIRKEKMFRGIKTYGGGLRVYDLPKKNTKYFLGADISTGRSRDYTTISIMDKKGEEALSFRARIPIGEAAILIDKLGRLYNRALAAPESNDIGLGVATKLQELNYPNLYYSSRVLKEKGKRKAQIDKIPGWYTTRKNRPVMIAGLEEDMRENALTIKDPFFIQEAYTFIYDEQNRPVAMGKAKGASDDDDGEVFTDDTIFAKAIGNHIRKGISQSPIVLPQ